MSWQTLLVLFIILSYMLKSKQISPIFNRVQWGGFLKPLILLGLWHFLKVKNLPTKQKLYKKRQKISPIFAHSPTTDGAFVVGENRMCTGFAGILGILPNLPSNSFYKHYFSIAPFKKMWNTENEEQTFLKIRKYGLCGCYAFF